MKKDDISKNTIIKDYKKDKHEINVILLDEKIIRVEHSDGRFVEGKKNIPYGRRKFVKNLERPSKMRYKGDNDIIIDMPEYKDSADADIYILQTQLTSWSSTKKISKASIMENEDLCDLFEKFIEEIKEINNLNPQKSAKNVKKSDTSN